MTVIYLKEGKSGPNRKKKGFIHATPHDKTKRLDLETKMFQDHANSVLKTGVQGSFQQA